MNRNEQNGTCLVFVPGESERIRRCRLQKEMRGEREKGGGGGGNYLMNLMPIQL